MATVSRNWTKVAPLLALIGTAITLMLMTAPRSAEAWSNYCGGTLGGYGSCWGAQRQINAVYGWGTDHGVCVWASYTSGGVSFPQGCAPTNTTAYQPYSLAVRYPGITNSGQSANRVHGVAYP